MDKKSNENDFEWFRKIKDVKHVSKTGLPVRIELKTEIKQNHDVDTFELTVFGQYYQKGETTYLIYDEVNENGTIHTVVKYHPENGAQILRKGALNMRLSYQKGKMMTGLYQTNVGNFHLGTDTKELNFLWNDTNKIGTLQINYNFYIESQEVGKYTLSFKFKEERK